MREKLTEQEVLDVLHAIERGEVLIPKEQLDAADASFRGGVEFTCSNGWRFVIYSDLGEWDYIDSVYSPDERSLSAEDVWRMPILCWYSPPEDVGMRVWGLKS